MRVSIGTSLRCEPREQARHCKQSKSLFSFRPVRRKWDETRQGIDEQRWLLLASDKKGYLSPSLAPYTFPACRCCTWRR